MWNEGIRQTNKKSFINIIKTQIPKIYLPESAKIISHVYWTVHPVVDGTGTEANAKHPWLGYTQSCIQQKQPVEFDGFGTRGYLCMLYSLGSTKSTKIKQNQVIDFDDLGVNCAGIYASTSNGTCVCKFSREFLKLSSTSHQVGFMQFLDHLCFSF